MKVTQWFDGSVKPYHPGVYQAIFGGGLIYFFNWDGGHWSSCGFTPEEASEKPRGGSNKPHMWRDLAEKP